MGSAGGGRFGTYSEEGMGSVTGGKSSNSNECPDKLEGISLEDVGISDYYIQNDNVPPVGENVELLDLLVGKRLAVGLSNSKIVLGNLPVQYNFLNICLKKGKHYSGVIIASGLSPTPYIVVNLHA